MFSNVFLAHIRALSQNPSYPKIQSSAHDKIAKLGSEILKPVDSMVELGIFRPLPYGPNERQFYDAVQQFAIAAGVASK